jgi:protein phosphatase
MVVLKYGAGSDVGNIRSHNEDCFSIEPELGLWIVADGMGGHRGGETASALAADFIVNSIKEGESLEKSIARAHHVIKEESKRGKGPEGMGTTVVALKTQDKKYEIAWVGDCRAYLWDGKQLVQLTKDHSYVQHLVDKGVISPSEKEDHPYQDVLIQALGAKDIQDVSVDMVTNEWHQNEQVLLCSDGLTKELHTDDIIGILSLQTTEQKKVDSLISMALERGGKDNITAMVISADDDAPLQNGGQDTVPIDTCELDNNQHRFGSVVISWLKRFAGRLKQPDKNK